MEVSRSSVSGIGRNTSNEVKDKKNSLSVDDFLKIMAAEIKNQSPMGGDGGGSKTDYISQLAQFTSLEQLTKLSDNISILTLMGQQQYSFSLIGKEVTVLDDEGPIKGVVDKVKFQDGIALIQVNNNYYYLGSVIEVGKREVEK